jgi:hypothetical protein
MLMRASVAMHYSINIGGVSEQTTDCSRWAAHSTTLPPSATNSSVSTATAETPITAVVAF